MRHPSAKGERYPLERVTRPDDRHFDEFYDFMATQFPPDVTENRESYVASLEETAAGKSSSPYVLIVMPDKSKGIRGYASGSYLPIIDEHRRKIGKSIGGLGHVMVQPGLRARGLGTILINAFEATCREYATGFRQKYLGLVGEMEDRAVGPFSRLGFRWPRLVYYAQPPLIYDKNGEKRYFEVPENLMLRLASGKREIETNLLKNVVRSMYEFWIMKDYGESNKKRWKKIHSYLYDKVFDDFCCSVDWSRKRGNSIPLVEPGPSIILAQDHKTGLIARRFVHSDLHTTPAIGKLFGDASMQGILERHLKTAFDDNVRPTAFEFTDHKGLPVGAGIVKLGTNGRGEFVIVFVRKETVRKDMGGVQRLAREILSRVGISVVAKSLEGLVLRVAIEQKQE